MQRLKIIKDKVSCTLATAPRIPATAQPCVVHMAHPSALADTPACTHPRMLPQHDAYWAHVPTTMTTDGGWFGCGIGSCATSSQAERLPSAPWVSPTLACCAATSTLVKCSNILHTDSFAHTMLTGAKAYRCCLSCFPCPLMGPRHSLTQASWPQMPTVGARWTARSWRWRWSKWVFGCIPKRSRS